MSKVMVIGATSLLGQYMMAEARSLGMEAVGTYNSTVPSDAGALRNLDIVEPDEVNERISQEGPDMVVLCSALTNVDRCEREPDLAYRVNAEGAFNVASACRSSGSKMVFVSTDYVFNGLKGGRYHEFDPPDPLSVYARSKLEGERVTLDASRGNLVCRVSVLYGWNRVGGRSNFVTWVIDSLRRGERVKLYTDQYVSPTYAPAAAKDILELGLRMKGVCHTSGPDCLSRYEIGLRVAEAFRLDSALIDGVTTEEMPMLAKRPKRSCLAVDMAEAELGRPMVPLREGLAQMVRTGN